MNNHGWQGPPSIEVFFNPCWKMAFRAGHRVPLTRSVTASVTESSPANEYWTQAGAPVDRIFRGTDVQSCVHIVRRLPHLITYLLTSFIQNFHKLGWKPTYHTREKINNVWENKISNVMFNDEIIKSTHLSGHWAHQPNSAHLFVKWSSAERWGGESEKDEFIHHKQ